ncbi:MAG TPA: trehalase-like domain-containing protein [Acidimicrobiales bacterium]|nr:trehalase-like domain-containing protein [Acidimicrobiales bacterium]
MTVGGGDGLDPSQRGMVGDTSSAALVAADGTADWWCPGRFDAPPVLDRLLDPAGACLRVAPKAAGPGAQSYLDGTLVLVTRLSGQESLLDVTDAMPWDGHRASGRIVRVARALRGPVEVAIELVPPAGPVWPWSEGVAFAGGTVRCPCPFVVVSEGRSRVARASARLDTGEALVVTIDHADASPLSPDAAERALARTAAAWRGFLAGAALEGPYAEAAARSAVVARALCAYGAPVSSPVTSLPRVVFGERNADGRVARPSVAAAWALAAAAVGLAEAADDAVRWLADALDHDAPLPSALAPDGEAPPTEAVLTGLSGWRRSQPVVAGSNAPERRSAEPAAALLCAAAELGGELEARWAGVVAQADWLADHWAAPDASVWDLRGPPRPWVSARLAAREGLARLAERARRRNPLDFDAAGWAAAARDIERSLLHDGVGPDGVLRPLTDALPASGQWDAALARCAWQGPWPAGDHVVRATLDRARARNEDGGWLVPWPVDLDDGLPGAEPPSVTATLWWARAAALTGDVDAAHERVEAVLALAGPLGLLPEAVDPRMGMALGNRPSAEAHVALLSAVASLSA